MNYFEFTFNIKNLPEVSEGIIIVELDRLGFEGIIEEKGKIIAYASEKSISVSDLSNVQRLFIYNLPEIKYKYKLIKETNWNELWENNFEPVIFKNRCIIRAPFHTGLPSYEYEIIIEPKMSFGTGHHETTSLMIEKMLEMDIMNKIVLDMGCGTGILAILASKMNAKEIIAVDNEKWPYQNAKENCKRNKAVNVKVMLSDKSAVSNLKFDLILSNISKNIHMDYLEFYNRSLHEGGILLLSGFYKDDASDIKKKAEEMKFIHLHSDSKNNWAIIKLIKKE